MHLFHLLFLGLVAHLHTAPTGTVLIGSFTFKTDAYPVDGLDLSVDMPAALEFEGERSPTSINAWTTASAGLEHVNQRPRPGDHCTRRQQKAETRGLESN